MHLLNHPGNLFKLLVQLSPIFLLLIMVVNMLIAAVDTIFSTDSFTLLFLFYLAWPLLVFMGIIIVIVVMTGGLFFLYQFFTTNQDEKNT